MSEYKKIEIDLEETSNILSRLTFHFVSPKERKKLGLETTRIILAALSKSIELVEKQKPKKALEIREKRDFNNELLLKDGYCPCCKHEMSNAYIYCNKCGQRIDWEE